MRYGIVIVLLMFLVACGFVVEDGKSEVIDYEKLVESFQVVSFFTNVGRGGALSTPQTNESCPQVYRFPSGKTFLFFVGGPIDGKYVKAAEKLDNDFGSVKQLQQASYDSFMIVEGKSNGVQVPLLIVDYGLSELREDLSVVSLGPFGFPSMMPVMVWNGNQWERWIVDNYFGELSRIELVWQSGNYQVVTKSLCSHSALESLSPDMASGIGVIESKETNFAFLMAFYTSLVGVGEVSVFQVMTVTLREGTVTLSSNRVYTNLIGVGAPFIDVYDGYKVYFSMRETLQGEEHDLYRFNYLTFEKLLSPTLRRKLP